MRRILSEIDNEFSERRLRTRIGEVSDSGAIPQPMAGRGQDLTQRIRMWSLDDVFWSGPDTRSTTSRVLFYDAKTKQTATARHGSARCIRAMERVSCGA
jgi:hypothetical protein